RARERPPLVENDAPRHHREEREDEDDELRGNGRAGDEIDDQVPRVAPDRIGRNPARSLHLQGEPQASKRAQTILRDISCAPLGQRVGRTVSRRANRCQTYVTIGVLSFSPMLRYLRIHRLAVIDSVEVEFDAGLNVLTGETGAGKSILVEAVGLLLGGRASGDLVRTGEESA